MCDCIKLCEIGLRSTLRCEDAEIQNVEMLSGRIYSTVYYTKDGKKKQHNLLHSFCPICGQKYSDGGKNEN